MSEATFVSASPGPKNSVIYETDEGTRYSFEGGDRAWRNNNPGNLVPGKVSKRNDSIGAAGGFAVFSDYETGHAALIDSLNNEHGNEDLEKMIQAYAPDSENDTARYLRFIRGKTGVKDNRKIKDFTSDQFEKLWKAIEKMEGNKRGKITELSDKKRITAVRKNKKGTIIAYFVEDLGWIEKDEGIELARQGKIDAVVATSRNGNLFLKARPDDDTSNNLGNLG